MWRSESKTVEVEDTEEKNEEELNIRLEEKKKKSKGKIFRRVPPPSLSGLCPYTGTEGSLGSGFCVCVCDVVRLVVVGSTDNF